MRRFTLSDIGFVVFAALLTYRAVSVFLWGEPSGGWARLYIDLCVVFLLCAYRYLYRSSERVR